MDHRTMEGKRTKLPGKIPEVGDNFVNLATLRQHRNDQSDCQKGLQKPCLFVSFCI